MTYRFNLTEEKWIPCIDNRQNLVILSIRELFSEAHRLADLAADLPIMNGALFLFLLAFASAANPLKDLDNWEHLYKNGKFPETATEDYIRRWRDRFDLFDTVHPFYQDPQFGKRAKDLQNLKNGQVPIPKSLKDLLMHLSSGSNATLFDHSMDAEDQWYLPAEAARLLVTMQPYSLGGMTSASIGIDKYYKDSPFSRGITFLCRGTNLFDSLLQNMVPVEVDAFSQAEKDRPCWEVDDAFSNTSGEPAGLLDLMTYQSRRLLLFPENVFGEVKVKDCFTAPGLAVVETKPNPFYLVQYKEEKGVTVFKPLRFRLNGVTWRDSAVILDNEPNASDPPITRKLFEHLRAEPMLPNNRIRLDLFGMVTEPGKKVTYDYVHERFDAPAVYLEDQQLYQQLADALSLAEAVRSSLYFATSTLASYKIYPEQDVGDSISPDKKTVSDLYDHVNMEPRFWGALESPFYQLLNQLPRQPSALEEWKSALKSAAIESLAASAEMTGDDASSLKARAKAEMSLGYHLRKALNPEQEEDK